MAKSNSSKSSKSSSNKTDNAKRHKPLSPPGGFSGKGTRYGKGGKVTK